MDIHKAREILYQRALEMSEKQLARALDPSTSEADALLWVDSAEKHKARATKIKEGTGLYADDQIVIDYVIFLEYKKNNGEPVT